MFIVVVCLQVGGASVAGPLPPARDWRKGAKRVRRNSHVDTAHRAVPGLNTNGKGV